MKAWKRLSFGLGVMAVGFTTGCQGTSTQLVNPGVLRGESAVTSSASSPAYAQIAGGRNLPAPVFAGQPMPPMQAMGNGMVMPNGTMVMPGVAQVAHGQSMPNMPMNGMPSPMGMANMGNMPMMQNMPAMPTTPSSGNPSMNGSVMVVNGPAGPQYVYVEMLGPVNPGTGTAPSSPTTLPTLPPTIVTPEAAKEPSSAPPAPSFDAPVPTAIPLPTLPTGRSLPTEDSKVPEILPPVGLKSSQGPALKPLESTTIPVGYKVEGPALPPLNLPAPPAAKPSPAPAAGSEIPPAPIFVPAAN